MNSEDRHETANGNFRSARGRMQHNQRTLPGFEGSRGQGLPGEGRQQKTD